MELTDINTLLRGVLLVFSIFFTYRYVTGWGMIKQYWGEAPPLFPTGWIKPKKASKSHRQNLFIAMFILWFGTAISFIITI